MGGRSIHKMTCRRVKPLITRVHLHMHHVPTFELNIIHLPLFSLIAAFKDEATLLCSNENHDLFAHHKLLSTRSRINVLLILYHEIFNWLCDDALNLIARDRKSVV